MRDRFLTEAMGKCWHEFPIYAGRCNGCGERMKTTTREKHRIDFSVWESFGVLWEWVHKQDWSYEFQGYANGTYMECFMTEEAPNDWMTTLIDPDEFANEVYEFLKERA